MLEFIFRRCDGQGEVAETPFGLVPAPEAIDTHGLNLDAEVLDQLLTVDPDAVRDQLPQVEQFLERFGDDLPAGLRRQFDALRERLG